MSLADVTYADDLPESPVPLGGSATTGAAYFCDKAINALGDAIKAITFNDIAGRCNAVSTATEAATCLYLELDTRVCRIPLVDAGRSYETLLTHFVDINLRNDLGATSAAIRLLGRLRDGIAHPDPAAQAPGARHHAGDSVGQQALKRTL